MPALVIATSHQAAGAHFAGLHAGSVSRPYTVLLCSISELTPSRSAGVFTVWHQICRQLDRGNMRANAKLATAFVIGAAVSAVLLKVRTPREFSLSHKPAPGDLRHATSFNPERHRSISGSVLEPLSQEVLINRSSEAFPIAYLSLISIIQSVALGILLTETVTILSGSSAIDETIAVASRAAVLFGFLVIISYEYLWFIGILRWVSTFRDTLIPYAIGVAEIIPCLMLDQALAWWVATTVIPVICAAALLNTIARLDPLAFPGKPGVCRRVRVLTWRTIICCGVITAIGGAGSALLALGILRGLLLSMIPLATILPAIVAVGICERSLNYVFESYGISRRQRYSLGSTGFLCRSKIDRAGLISLSRTYSHRRRTGMGKDVCAP
jgi:hypothetical protein